MKAVMERLMQEDVGPHLTWDAIKSGKRAWICFQDDRTYDLGIGRDVHRFSEIADRKISGHYDLPDAIEVTGKIRAESGPLRRCDQVLQIATILDRWGRPRMRSAVEMFVVERD
jgi:hypothetical protein